MFAFADGSRFVRKQLAVARTVVVNTRKYDIHRRYVAHVFYAFNNRGMSESSAVEAKGFWPSF